MKEKLKNLDPNVLLAFYDFYKNFYKNNWGVIERALLEPKVQVACINAYSDWDLSIYFNKEERLNVKPFQAYLLKKNLPIIQGSKGLKIFYPMDLASLLPVLALDLKDTDKALDLCAGPGGKGLLMSQQLKEIHLNEPSLARFKRLKRLFADYVPASKIKNINFFQKDGRQWGLKKALYDKILVDAPCSGERHLLHNPQKFNQWTDKRSKNLSHRQYALLTAGWEALKPGGRLVYSTCALCPLENEAVVNKFLKKKPAQVIQKKFLWGEATTHGWQVIPGLHGPWGPAYFCILQKEPQKLLDEALSGD